MTERTNRETIDANPMVWLLLLGSTALLCLATSNPLLLLLLAVALIMVGMVVKGPRMPFLRLSVTVALVVLLIWLGLTLLLQGDQNSSVVLQRPSWAPGAGVQLGGDLTLSGLLDGITNGLRATCLVLVLGLAGQCVSGRSWAALADNTLGALAPVLRPLCHLPEAYCLSQHGAARARQWVHGAAVRGQTLPTAVRLGTATSDHVTPSRVGSTLRAVLALVCFPALILLSFTQKLPAVLSDLTGAEQAAAVTGALVVIGAALPGRDQTALRITRADVPVLAAGALLAAILITGEAFVPGTALAPPAGAWPELPLILLLAVVALPTAVMAGSALVQRSPVRVKEVSDAA